MDLQKLLKLLSIQDASAAVSDPEQDVSTQAMPIAQDFDPNYANMLEGVPGDDLNPSQNTPKLKQSVIPKANTTNLIDPPLPAAEIAPTYNSSLNDTAPVEMPPDIGWSHIPSYTQPKAIPAELPKVPLEQKLPALAATGEDDLIEALKEARRVRGGNDLLRAATSFARGIDKSYGSTLNPNEANPVLDSIDQNAKGRADDILTVRKASGERVERASKELDFNDKKVMRDPSSPESNAMREQIFAMYPQYKDNPGFKNASGKQLDDTFKFLNLKDAIDARRQASKEAASARVEAAALKQNTDNKEQVQIRKEERKAFTTLDDNEKDLKMLKEKLLGAKKQFEEYSKKKWFGTGPIATGFGAKKLVDQDTSALDSKLKTVALDSMVKTFAGMSKAIDTGPERAAFEATQPQTFLDDDVNAMIFEDKLQAVDSLIRKAREGKERLTGYPDNFKTAPEAAASSPENEDTEESRSAARQKEIADLRAKLGK